ncbi:hypothetical protein KP806_18350 [Paenibacillus sp. N4]|uniref:hypothetical protein n=1 Tax=Paenibacillus vietnamensis TaxID=2590547 RepID=UPI001CD08766|nr:hypothetical protein [Paenibacillus vietnamensis]MCA0757026.1 hypothetical protein [Paenibacillus vietnamensis]
MKKYALCDTNKRCLVCGSSLQLVRKQATWYYQMKQTPIERPTNLYNCNVCKLDHVIKGDHIDDSGWERLVLPLANSFELKSNIKIRHSGKSSPVKTIVAPKKKEHTSGKQQDKPQQKTKPTPQQKAESDFSDVKKAKGIYRTNHDYRNCGNCDFYIKGRCQTFSLPTASNEVCRRFKHYHKREVFGGGFSPR